MVTHSEILQEDVLNDQKLLFHVDKVCHKKLLEVVAAS